VRGRGLADGTLPGAPAPGEGAAGKGWRGGVASGAEVEEQGFDRFIAGAQGELAGALAGGGIAGGNVRAVQIGRAHV